MNPNPDFIAVLEINNSWMNELKALKKDYLYSIVFPREDNFGIAFFSKAPILKSEKYDFGNIGIPSISAVMSMNGKNITVIATHPLPPVSKDSVSFRNRHIAELGRSATNTKGAVMVLGDMNTTSWTPVFKDMIKTSGLNDSRRGFGVQSSWPADIFFMRIPIDHCLFSDEIKITNREVGPFIGSDHFPVIIDFTIK